MMVEADGPELAEVEGGVEGGVEVEGRVEDN